MGIVVHWEGDSMRRLVVAVLMLVLALAGPSAATTLHYWQFESSPGFLQDSVGGSTLTSTGSASQVALPASGRGSDFATGALSGNAAAADLAINGWLRTSNVALGDFTVEALAHADAFWGSSGDTIVGAADAQNNVNVGWLLQVRSSQLSFALCYGASCDLNLSGISIVAGKDYYLAAAVDLAGGQTTFYVQNLTDGGALQTAVASNAFTAFNQPTYLAIGATGDGSLGFDGLIDEVRISDRVLGAEELMIVPEPSVAQLLGLGLACLSLARRRSRHR